MHCSTKFCRKKESQFDSKEEIEANEERKGIIFCML